MKEFDKNLIDKNFQNKDEIIINEKDELIPDEEKQIEDKNEKKRKNL